MNILEEYTKIIESVDFAVDEGYIYSSSNVEDRVQGKVDGLPLVLPTKDHLKTLSSKDGTVNKIPFNVFLEDAFAKEDSGGIKLIRFGIASRLKASILGIGTLLLKVANTDKLQNSAPYEITKFLTSLKDVYKKRKIAQDVTDDTIDVWNRILTEPLKLNGEELSVINISSKKSGKIGKNTFNRVTTYYSPMYDALVENPDAIKAPPKSTAKNKNYRQLRKADAIIYKAIINYIFAELDKDNTLKVGSNDGYAPTFITTYQIFQVLAKRINEILDNLKYVNEKIHDESIIKISDINLNELKPFMGLAKAIPNEKELKTKAVNMKTDKEDSISDKVLSGALGLNDINQENANANPGVVQEEDDGLGFLNASPSFKRRDMENRRAERGNGLSAGLNAILNGETVDDRRSNREEEVHPDYDVNRIYNESPRYNRRRNRVGGTYTDRIIRDTRGSRDRSRRGRGEDSVVGEVLTSVEGRRY